MQKEDDPYKALISLILVFLLGVIFGYVFGLGLCPTN